MLKKKHREEVGAGDKKHREEVGAGKRRQGEAVKVHQQRASKKLSEQGQATADAQKALHDAISTFNTASKVACSSLLGYLYANQTPQFTSSANQNVWQALLLQHPVIMTICVCTESQETAC